MEVVTLSVLLGLASGALGIYLVKKLLDWHALFVTGAFGIHARRLDEVTSIDIPQYMNELDSNL